MPNRPRSLENCRTVAACTCSSNPMAASCGGSLTGSVSKQKTLALGIYPTVSLAEARGQREEAKKLLARFIDPSAKRKADRQAGVGNASEPSLKKIAKQEREGRAQITLRKKRWLLDFAFPAFGDRPVAEITARDLLALLERFEGRGLYETTKRLRSTCGMVFRYAIATGRAERDPSMDLRGALTTHRVIHRAAIVDPAGIGALLRAIDGFDGSRRRGPRFGLRRMFLCDRVSCGTLSGRNLTWMWPCGPSRLRRRKMRREHRVPLDGNRSKFY